MLKIRSAFLSRGQVGILGLIPVLRAFIGPSSGLATSSGKLPSCAIIRRPSGEVRPGNAGWQRDLSVSVGDVLVAQAICRRR